MPVVAYWTLARPAMLPLVLLLVACGYGLGHWEFGLDVVGVDALALVLVAWSLLHAGTLWLNAALDRDEGAVLFGGSASVPAHAASVGAAALVGCVLFAVLAGLLPGLCGALAAALAVLYSHPATAWKGHPVGGPLVNFVGYGLLTPLAGWSVVGAPLTGRTVALLAVLGVAMLGLSLLAQVGQGAEDRARGYRTLAAIAGDARAAHTGAVMVGLASLLFVGLAAVGLLPRLVLVVVPLLGWLVLRARMARASADVGRLVGGLLGIVLLSLSLVLVDHLDCLVAGGPVGGQCTAVVPPAL